MKELLASFFQMDPSEITTFFLIAQAIGPITTVMSIVSAQMKSITWILAFELIVNVLVALSYILLGGISGSYICLVASVQTIFSFYYAKKEKPVPKVMTGVFILIYLAISVYTYQTPLDIIPGICAVTFALSVVQGNSAGYRFYMALNSVLWVVYDLVIGAYTMIFTHGLLLGSLVIAMFRHDRKKETKE